MPTKENKPKKVDMHKGHRRRLRKNLIVNQWESFEEHQLIEYVLSLTIARKNTNDVAHRLIENFGTFANVLDASFEDLMEIKGVGEVTATYLTGLPNIFKLYKQSKMKKRPVLTTADKVFEHFGSTFNHMPNEEFYVICVDSLSRLIVAKLIGKGTNSEVAFTLKTITETAVRTKAQGVILIHNHPNGSPSPSSKDIEMTRQIYYNLMLNNIAVLDHIIIGKEEGSFYSFKRSSLLDGFSKDLEKMMGNSQALNCNMPPYEENFKGE